MCKAPVQRFSCGHAVLMSLDSCKRGPCPVIKTTGAQLPPQPYRCYNCQHKLEKNMARPTSLSYSTNSSVDSIESNSSRGSRSSGGSSPTFTSSLSSSPPKISHPLPGVAVQPKGCVRFNRSQSSSGKNFSFSCNSSSHFIAPHYSGLPTFLPHQNHACPPCQLEEMRMQADAEAIRLAREEFPNLKEEMLVSDGRVFDPEIMSKPTLQKYIEEKRTEEREMWFHVTRKWTQDLKRARVLVAEEDGLGLIG